MSKISFLTFASSDWIKSPIRFKEDLGKIREQYGFFDKEFIWNENDLDEEYRNRFSPYFKDHGFGYFSWKPYSIRQALTNIDDGDSLMYLDSGCVLPMERIQEFLGDVKNTVEIIVREGSLFALSTYIDKNPNVKIPNACIVRKQILNRFNLLQNEEFLFRFPHYQAGLFIIQKNKNTLNFLSRWYEFFKNNYESCIRSDYRDKTGQQEHFLQNGSDQAILQCMLYSESVKITDMNFVYKYDLIAHRIG